MASVHIYGESNTYGVGDLEGGGYASRLRTTMVSRITEPAEGRRGVIVHNFARFAMMLDGVVKMLPASLANRDGRGRLIAAVMVGFCDSAIRIGETRPALPLPDFRRQLGEFTELCQATEYPVHPLFIEAPPIDISRPHPRNPGDICPVRYAGYLAAVREHAEQTKAPFIGTHTTLQSLPEDPLSSDGIHLSSAGHAAVHNLLLAQVDTILS